MREFVEQSGGNVVPALRVGQGEKNRVVGGLALLHAVKHIQPSKEFLPAVGQGQRWIVSDVVAAAHEGVHSAQGFAFAAREDEEGVIKVLRRCGGDAFA